ncbi:MAG: sulfatase-like hydrolase/transferase [candidate division Zixibacteria bacterium]|nr:sulfatase-like hydrolase/transferase [candidate division Zixibacteria bacterium]
MPLKQYPSNISCLYASIAGATVGLGLIGLAESFEIMLRHGVGERVLPFYGLLYYGASGLLFGIVIGTVAILLKIISGRKLSNGRLFSLSSGAGIGLLTAYISLRAFRSIDVLISLPLVEDAVFGILAIVSFIIVYNISTFIYDFIANLTDYPTTAFLSFYLLLLTSSFVLILGSSGMISSLDIKKEEILSHKTKDPNVILCVLDCLRYDFVSTYSAGIHTPNLQLIANEGITYTDVYANSNWTKPATASLLTSVWPDIHNAHWHDSSLPGELVTLPEALRKNGYITAGFSTNANIMADFGFDQGFDDFYYFDGKRTAFPYKRGVRVPRIIKLIEPVLVSIFPGVKAHKMLLSDAEYTTDKVISWLDKNGKTPFFLYLHYMDAHAPYHDHPYKGNFLFPYKHGNSEHDIDRFMTLYKEEIEFFDNHFGRLIRFLEEVEVYDNTMIVFTSDHGEEFFEHYLWEHGQTMYDEVLHIPLIIKGPRIKQSGGTDSALVAQIDIAPTILDLLDIAIPRSWLGESFISRDTSKCFVLSQAINGSVKVRQKQYVLESIMTRRYKLIEIEDGHQHFEDNIIRGVPIDPRGVFPPRNMFDRIEDPDEMNNLYGDPQYDSVIEELMVIDSLTDNIIEKSAIAVEQRELDSELIEKLKAIGYIDY